MRIFLRILGFVWLLPITIPVWLVYVLPLWALGQITFKGWYSPLIAAFQLVNSNSWYAKRWKDWYGWSGPCMFIYKDLPGDHDAKKVFRTMEHEERHCLQQFVLGPLFYPAYLFSSLWIWLFMKTRHAYFNNPFEMDARAAAKQRVYLGPEHWPNGRSDRWPWW